MSALLRKRPSVPCRTVRKNPSKWCCRKASKTRHFGRRIWRMENRLFLNTVVVLPPVAKGRGISMKRAVLYLRVSTTEQTTANQEHELREIAARMGCEVVRVYRDHGISGAKGRDGRPEFDRLCRDAAKRQFDLVMAWSVDRLGRSLQDLVGFLSELHALKIDLFLHQQGLVPDAGRVCRVRKINHPGTRPRRPKTGQERRKASRQASTSPRTSQANPRGSEQAGAHRGRAQDRCTVWRRSFHCSADQPPFRRKRRRRVKRRAGGV